MERFAIEIIKDRDKLTFEVIDYVHSDDHHHCKFEVFIKGKLVASFEPDNKGFLHICKNANEVNEEVLHLIADKLETMLL